MSTSVEKSGAARRVPGDKETNPATIKVDQLQADFAVVVDTKSNAKTRVSKVTQLLNESGLYTFVVPGAGKSAIVGVRISPETLATVAQQSQARDWAAGMRTPAFSFEEPGLDTSGISITPSQRTGFVSQAIHDAGVRKLSYVVQDFPVGPHIPASNVLGKQSNLFTANPNIIRAHYGEEVAMYFVFANYTLVNMVLPAAMGVVTLFTEGPFSTVLGISSLIWTLIYVFGWRRTERVMALRWGTRNVKNIKTPCENYRGTTPLGRQLKRLMFYVVAANLFLLYILGLMLVLAWEMAVVHLFNGPSILNKLVALTPTGANVVLAQGFQLVYSFFLKKYVEWEDYETKESQRAALTQRSFFATFLINFAPLLLSSYVYLPGLHYIEKNVDVHALAETISGISPYIEPLVLYDAGSVSLQYSCKSGRLAAQTFYFTVVNQAVVFGTTVILPLVKLFVLKRMTLDKKPGALLRLAQKTTAFNCDIDYAIIVSMVGYTLITGLIWPLAPLAVLVGVAIRIRCSVAELTLGSRRPNPVRVESIGPWNSNLLFIAGVAFITTPTLWAMYGRNVHYDFINSLPEYPINVSAWVVFAAALVGENVFLAAVKIVESVFAQLPIQYSQESSFQKQEGVTVATVEDDQWKAVSNQDPEL